jgi:GT2 family glycosyltransferase
MNMPYNNPAGKPLTALPEKHMYVIAAIVTYNRKDLLLQCLKALFGQTRQPDQILIVDNASTDGTYATLAAQGWLAREKIRLLALKNNIGGAGGFATAVQYALEQDKPAWIWLMDDDALPRPDALEILCATAGEDRGNIYGSLAVAKEECAWGLRLVDGNELIVQAQNMPRIAKVKALPFLGFFVHTDLVLKIGLPQAGFFISADDLEYCIRARHHGVDVICVSQSRVEHPRVKIYFFKLLGLINLTCQRFPPWRRYYAVRNNILCARKYHDPGSIFFMLRYQFFRLLASLCREPEKFLQLRAYLAGFIDGILGLEGKRHRFWRLPK